MFKSYSNDWHTYYHMNRIHIDGTTEPDEMLSSVLDDDDDDDDDDDEQYARPVLELLAIYGWIFFYVSYIYMM